MMLLDNVGSIALSSFLPWDAQSAAHPFCDFFQHDLGRAAADRLDACIAHHPLDRALADIAHAAMELLTVIHDLIDQLAAIRLGHRNFLDAVAAQRIEPGGVVDELPPGLDFGG